MRDISTIRNFCIIAHIDHGKSTLADRMLELTGTIAKRDLLEQTLDGMDLERERGITIKSHPVQMHYDPGDGVNYELNLIDTPGHVDFSYEVSRSLSACEGAVLLIDATQGVQAQTVANVNLAFRENLRVIPVINKIDLPAANLELCYTQMEEILALPREEALCVSGKTGVKITRIVAEGTEFRGVDIEFVDSGELEFVPCDGLFVAIGLIPENEPFKDLADLNQFGYFDSDEQCMTHTPGIFVAGDCRSKGVRQLTTAVADGATAALAASRYIADKF